MKSDYRIGLTTVAAAILASHFFASASVAQCNGTWTQRSPAAAPSGRTDHALAYDSARRMVVLFGGQTPAYSDETWEWDGNNWLQRTPSARPSARAAYAMVYDASRGVTVLFGGFVGGVGVNGETWEWDGTNWTMRTPANSPTARYTHAMVYDSARAVSVLFGGYDNADDNETWEWNGTDWTLRTPATSPTPRSDLAMAYDSARGVTVLFGGLNNETWEWDGTNWTQRIPALSPSARTYHAMVFDSARGVTVLFGGGDDQTWEWDGVNWTRLLAAPAPSARDDHGFAYDSFRHVTVLFGGYLAPNPINAQTWEWIGPRPAVTNQPGARSVAPGQSAAFSITADGLAPLSYRWRKDGAPLTDAGAIAGATTPTLTINPTAAADAGVYSCVVTNPCGNTLSRSATLSIVQSPPGGCGACGAGMATMIPMTILGLVVFGRGLSRRPGSKGTHS